MTTRPTQVKPPRTAVDRTDMTPPAGIVTVLRLVGRDDELRLSPAQLTFSIGSGAVDLVIGPPRDDEGQTAHKPWKYVSNVHAYIHRRANRLGIQDAKSTNGIIFASGHKEDEGEIGAGESFLLGGRRGVKLLALDEHLVVLRKELQWGLGFKAHAAVDEALEVVAKGAPLSLIGEPGCDQRDLARHIHVSSWRRNAKFAELVLDRTTEPEAEALLASLDGGTVFVDFQATSALPPRALVRVATEDRIRVVAAAASVEQLQHRLGAKVAHRFGLLAIPPVRARRDDIPTLLNTLFVRHGSQREITELKPAEKLAQLCAQEWPQNIDQLRQNVKRLLAKIDHGSDAAAARALGISRQSFAEAMKRIGL